MFQHQDHINKIDSECLENYGLIYVHENELDQGVVFWGIWFLCTCDNYEHCFEMV